jgi:hypothetical protein
MNEMMCPISGRVMTKVFTETILNKYVVSYYYCEESGLLKTEKPYWIDESYQSAIAKTDTGILQRNIYNSLLLQIALHFLFKGEGRFLDVSGGYGILARLMRDKGFDFYTIDKYCPNLFASDFEPEIGFKAKSLCAFEVLEHIENPKVFLGNIFDEFSCRTIIFSTNTFSNNQIPNNNWDYYSFNTGQHITFYQPRTLKILADSFGLHYYMISSNLHIITDIKLSKILIFIMSKYRLLKLCSLYVEYKRKNMSKTLEDHSFISNKNSN